MATFFALLAFIFAVLFGLTAGWLYQAKSDARANEMDLVRYQGISDLEKHKKELTARLQKAKEVLPKLESVAELQRHKDQLAAHLAEGKQASKQWQARISEQKATLEELTSQAEAVEETLEMQSFGLYRPRYGFESATRYENELKIVREKQKNLVKADRATHCAHEVVLLDGSEAKGRKMIQEHVKLLLRAFNGECDAAIGKVKYDNVKRLETRIERAFAALNKLGKSKQLEITRDYLHLKLLELYLVHEHREKVQKDREEQRQIKAQMREEEKAKREIEKARRDAEKEEESKTKALEKAKADLETADEKQVNRLQGIVDELEAELKDALERKAKAIARASLTRSGHVYVLSNVGSFGEGVYKIGLTRRLEPLDRVKELGDASVPFLYDVHAMIYSEDAPALESALHKHFADRRLNMANTRREFFRVTLDEIRDAIKQHSGDVTFVTTPKAEEYRRSLAIQNNGNGDGHTTGVPDNQSPEDDEEVSQAILLDQE